MADHHGPSETDCSVLYRAIKAGQISRRAVIARASAVGVGLPIILLALNTNKATPTIAAPLGQAPVMRAIRPAEGAEGQKRGAGGRLKLLQWRAPTQLGALTSTEPNDLMAASLITEPLLSIAQDGTLLPTLVSEVPSVENGGLSPDFTSVTYRLLPNVTWSDGRPFTADDVVFTWQWIMDEANHSPAAEFYGLVTSVEAVDTRTVKVAFSVPWMTWFIPFTSTYNAIYPQHFWQGKDQQTANDEFRRAPIGTGPYVVETFVENDQVTYKMNDNYREPNKPFFATVTLKGGIDSTEAARAVLETGDWDLASGFEAGAGGVDRSILDELARAGKGKVIVHPGAAVDRVNINFSDPNREVNGQRSEMHTPHPFLTEKAVRQALSLATDRQTISTELFSGPPGEPPGQNILVGIPRFESTNTSWEFSLDKANQVLDAAGWTRDGGVRKKGDMELRLRYATASYAFHPQIMEINRRNWEAVGFKVTADQIDPGVFFSDAAGNDQSIYHFYRDLDLYTQGVGFPYPLAYMETWYAGPEGRNIAQKSNDWLAPNLSRYNNREYDKLYERASRETDPETAAQLFIQMNDMLIEDIVIIPVVQRAAEKFAVANTLREGNISPNAWEVLYWNIANWNRVK
jgi:peptide/nickel transport system substrate-binding protein